MNDNPVSIEFLRGLLGALHTISVLQEDRELRSTAIRMMHKKIKKVIDEMEAQNVLLRDNHRNGA